MTKTQAIALLRENKDDRGVAHWKRLGAPGGLKSFGIGLTRLRKLAKQVGRDHELARKLWDSDIYDAKVLGLLVDDPKRMTREQAEAQVENLNAGMLAHVFASCDATLAKAPFAPELAQGWMDSSDPTRRRCAYSLVYELSKKKTVKGMDDDFFLGCIARIRESLHGEENWVRDTMSSALVGIGKRSKRLNKAAVRAAKTIGPIEVDYGDNGCQAVDILKHLQSDYLKKKLGL